MILPRANATPPMAMEVVMKLMEAPYHAPLAQHQHDSSHPTIGFPLGTALLLIVIFTLSGIFSCCYHWEKLRHLRGDFADDDTVHSDHQLSKPKSPCLEKKRDEDRSLPVIMAGDQFPRFIAMSCPCEPLKPPHVVIPMS